MMNGKVTIITGASRGIGAETARLLAKYGAKVVINYASNKKAAQKVVESITSKGGEAIAIKADVRSYDQMQSLVNETLLKFGKIDVLVNNAAIGFAMKPLSEMDWDDFKPKLEGEIKAAFIATKSVLPFMKEQRYGKLVYISSSLSHQPMPNFIAHGVAKGALNSFVKYLAQELGPYNITANTVAPSMVKTEATKHIQVEEIEKVSEFTPLGRIAKAEDVASAVLFFVSDQSAFITGTYAPVSGGMEMNN
ncbi:glucose 1-dehydrogenase (plasmid) [Niallia circulans]|uniref:Glucose 1-dehydrogenase n=1 Tax=Niallia circulans TaxID=1397 RepID=A0A553SQE9_NIACI|nr:glucose 1-dehydrogenase [Niallia circulans]TRZ39221.1 glucose 1-dehydrogenase [Niallia circulans]